MDTATQNAPKVEAIFTLDDIIKQVEVSGVNLGDDPKARINTFIDAKLLPPPKNGRFPSWVVQRVIAIQDQLLEGKSIADLKDEVGQERRRFLNQVTDLNSMVNLYRKFSNNSMFFLASFLLIGLVCLGIIFTSLSGTSNPVVVAGQNATKAVLNVAGQTAKRVAAPVGKTLVTIIKTSKPEDSQSADPLQLTNLEIETPVIPENLVQLDDEGNLVITGDVTATAFAGFGENLTSLPASEVVGELTLATLPWTSVTNQPTVLSAIDGISDDEGNVDLAAGTGISIFSNDDLDTITISNTDLGSSQLIFGTVAVASQADVVADLNNDILTIVAGSNIAITTNAAADSVTFSVIGTVGNAGTLDLLDSTQFLRSDAADQFTAGTLTFNAGTTLSVLGTFSCTNCVGDGAVANNITIDATGSINAGAISSGTLGAAGVTLALGSFGSITGALADANVANTLTIDATGSINAGAVSSGTLGAAGVTLALGSFGSITGSLADANVDDTITASNYLPLAGGTIAGNLTLSALSLSSGSRVANTTTFNPAGGGSQYGYNLSITNAPTVAANTAYGIYVSQSDTTTLANTNYGVYSTVTHTGPIAGTINTYGGYFSATGDTGGTNHAYGIYGIASGSTMDYGVYGSGTDYGVYGYSATGSGLYGDSTNYGVFGFGGSYGVYGFGVTGVYGTGTNFGVHGSGADIGVYGNGGNYGVYGHVQGVKTADAYSGYFSNLSTSSTDTIDKYGLYITSTGAWAGANANNYALYIDDATGGTNNYAIYQAGTTGGNVFKAATQMDNSLTMNSVVNPTVEGSVQDNTNLDWPFSVYVQGKYAYLTTSDSDHLTVVDISDPASPSVTGSVAGVGSFNYGVHVAGKYAYVAGYLANNLEIVDISDPTSPSIVGQVTDATNLNFARWVYVSGKYAYVAAAGNNRFTVVDVSDASAPFVVGSVQDNTNLNFANSVYVSGKYAYVTARSGDRLTVVDISNPAAPSVAGSVTAATLDQPESVTVSGRYAYVAAYNVDRLVVVDVLDPTTPSVVGSIQDATNLDGASSVYVSGKYAYVAAYLGDRLTVVDVSDPTAPSVAASVQDATNLDLANTVFVSGKYAYVGTGSNRLTVVNLVGIDAPTASIGNISANDISISENLDIANDLYVGSGLSVGPGGILTEGAIGAGTSTSTHILTGMLCIRNATACPAQAAGRLYVDTTGTAGDDPGDVFDIAEYFPATEVVEPGDVLIADPAQAKSVRRSAAPYDGSIIGIVSTSPAATIDEGFFSVGASEFNPTRPYVALAGRVPTRVSTENGPISIGDPLTSSGTPGVAMKATKSGPMVGKALESFQCPETSNQCTGKIMVFVNVGWFVATTGAEDSLTLDLSDVTSIDVETLAAETIHTQVLYIGERKISMAKDGSLMIEGDVKISGSLEADQVKTNELVISDDTSGTAKLEAGAKEITIKSDKIGEKTKVFIAFTTDYSPATRVWVTRKVQVGEESFTVNLDQPAAEDATFNWLIIN